MGDSSEEIVVVFVRYTKERVLVGVLCMGYRARQPFLVSLDEPQGIRV